MAMRDHPARLGDTYAPLGTMRLVEQSVVLLVVTVIVGAPARCGASLIV
jgi:hypothetical protein